jgi:hypothetical protein
MIDSHIRDVCVLGHAVVFKFALYLMQTLEKKLLALDEKEGFGGLAHNNFIHLIV